MTPEEKLKVYLQAQSAYDSKAIPGKNAFTFISKRTGMPQAWTLNEKQEPVLFGAFQDRVMSVHHAPDGDKTVIGMDHGGNEKQQLYLMYGEKAPVPLVVSHDHFHHFGGFSPYGEEIAFTSNRRHPGYFDVFIQNLETKQTRKVYIYNGKCEVLKWLPDGKHLLISLQTTNLNNSIYKLDIETGKVLTDAGENDDASYTSIVPTHDGKEAYLLTDHQAETTYISQMSLTALNERKTLYHEEKWDVEAIELSPDEKTLIFSVNEGGVSRLMVMETSTHDVRKMDGVPGGVISSMSWLDDTRCIFTLKTPVEPGDIWQVTLPEGQVKRLTHFGESVKSVPLYEPKICHYESFDGLRVPYFYYDHNESSDKPAVVYVHGGPEGQTRADYNPIIQYLVEAGFAVAAPNVRGSSGYGRTYIHLDDVRKRMDSVKDLAWLAKDLIHSHKVGQDKIGIMGRSYGGFMVLASLTHYPDLWAAGVDIVGISHFKSFLENTGAWRRHLREAEYGSLEDDVDFFEEIAPLNHSEKIRAPLLVFHGRNDSRVPVTEAEQLVADMKNRQQTVDLTIFEDEGHQTEKHENHMTMHTKTAHFFEKYLN
ncbi:MAG TPA: S9 family peptidase [Virgibacillus sp.]|nr:S9 family peptidase [Virgibacillus sp.]